MTWNRGAEEIYGWTEAEAIGKVMHQLLLTGSPVSIDDIDRKLTRDGRWDGELVHTRRDGKQIIVESRQVLRRDAAGAPIGILEINRDVNDRKRLEDQFRQAQKLEGIGRLAGGVAHDFNNLLTVISGYAGTALDELAAEHPLRGPMEQISKAAARATSLTRQLLIFSRRQVIEPKDIVLNDLVRDFEKMLRRLIGEDINLVLALDAGAGTIRADAGQIEQVILNLAVNARDAMPTGGTLSIETTSLLADAEFAQKHLSVQPGLYVVLAVSDTGVGMSPEVKSHLFEPFFTTKESGKGTGLGLTTVYGIVKQSGGSIWVYSEPGRGTTFRLLFPAVQAEGEAAAAVPVEVPSGSETILLVEDEPGVRRFARQELERRGYTVLEASNGREALELARRHAGPIHLVVTDVVMPEMGGAELADLLGAERSGVPVLFMSGYTNHSGQREVMGAGYLQKPFTSASLLTQVRGVLDAA
jgi:PAS domain S-box-containing protein